MNIFAKFTADGVLSITCTVLWTTKKVTHVKKWCLNFAVLLLFPEEMQQNWKHIWKPGCLEIQIQILYVHILSGPNIILKLPYFFEINFFASKKFHQRAQFFTAAVSNGRRKPRRFSWIRLPWLIVQTEVCQLSVCWWRNKQQLSVCK